MKSEEVVLISAVSATAGAVAHQSGLTTGTAWLDAAIGVGLAAVGWYLDYDGVGDAVEAFGVGYFLSAVL